RPPVAGGRAEHRAGERVGRRPAGAHEAVLRVVGQLALEDVMERAAVLLGDGLEQVEEVDVRVVVVDECDRVDPHGLVVVQSPAPSRNPAPGASEFPSPGGPADSESSAAGGAGGRRVTAGAPKATNAPPAGRSASPDGRGPTNMAGSGTTEPDSTVGIGVGSM